MEIGPALAYALVACAVMLAVGFPIHEWSHAMAAWRLGDSTARWQGRLSLDPRVHLDPTGAILLVVSTLLSGGQLMFGYARPTPVNPANLRDGRRGEALVALAGPLSNLVMAALVAVPLRVGTELYISGTLGASASIVAIVLNIALFFVLVNLTLFVFNLLPVPPLDGWKVLLGLVPPREAYRLRMLEARYAQVIPFGFLLVILVLGPVIVSPIIWWLLRLLVGTPYLLPA